MGKQVIKGLSLVLVSALLIGNAVPAFAAKKVKLSTKKISLKVGEKKKISVKNAGKKVKWSVKKGKKYISLSNKKKKSIVIKGKKEGKAVVQAKIGKKKLTCAVTVKKATKDNSNKVETTPQNNAPQATSSAVPQNTPLPNTAQTIPEITPDSMPQVTPETTPESTPQATPNQTVETPEGDITIDLTGIKTTFTSEDVAAIDFESQLGSTFALSNYKSLQVTYTTSWSDDSLKSGWALGKLAIAGTRDTLNGTSDGVAYTYGMSAEGGTASVSLGASKKGKAVGINIQPMMGEESGYKWPDGLESITVTGIVFKVPTEETVEPLPSVEFQYEGLDTAWIEENIDPTKPIVAMSFDDGPGGYDTKYVDYGMQIQEALKEAGAHATFFYVGGSVLKSAETKAEVLQAKEYGFEIGNHSWDFEEMDEMDAETVAEKYTKTKDVLKEVTGYSNFLFRAPGVAYSDIMFSQIDAPFIDVSNWSNDWDGDVTKDEIVANVKKAKDGDIINMHSVHEKTAQAVPEILAYFKEQGIQVVSVSELYAIRGEKLMTGEIYRNCPAK